MLDENIQVQSEALRPFSAQLLQLNKKQEETALLQKEKQKRLKQIEIEGEEDASFLSKHALLLQNGDQLSVIQTRVEQLQKLERELGGAKDRSTYATMKADFETKCDYLEEQMSPLESSLAGMSLTAIEESLVKMRQELQNLRDGIARSNEYSKQKSLAETSADAKVELEEKTAEIQKEVVVISNEIEIVTAYLKEYGAKLERLALEAKYEDDRKKLQEGEKCFLCGSTEHPFVVHYENEHEQVHQEFEIKKKNKEELLARQTKLVTQEAALKERLQSANEQYKVAVRNQEELLSDYTKLGLNISIEDIEALQEASETTTNEGLGLNDQKKQLQQHEEAKKLLQQYQVQLKLYGSLEEILSAIASQLRTFGENGLDFEKALENLSSIKERLTSLNAKKLERDKQQTSIQQELKHLDDLALEREQELLKLAEEMELVTTKLDQVKAERYSLLGEKEVQTVEDTERTALEQSAGLVQAIQAEIEKEKALIASQQEQLQKTNQQLKQTEADREALYVTLKKQLAGQKLSFEDYALLLPDAEYQEKKQKGQALADEKLKKQQSVLDLQERIALKKTKDVALDLSALLLQKNELDEAIEALLKQLSEEEHKLRSDQENKRKHHDLVLEIEQQRTTFKPWDLLRNHIGDKEGNKFSNFAQQLTFKRLIAISNRYLTSLNGRYILKKYEDSSERDDIAVLDTWQGDTERSASTLSGGESFLVSLALALGLSEMASRNVKIESLFIDEGFGTLDHETLELAMDTLENLQYKTNRKIALISHVDSLKERISTQIKLSKDASGFSSLIVE